LNVSKDFLKHPTNIETRSCSRLTGEILIQRTIPIF